MKIVKRIFLLLLIAVCSFYVYKFFFMDDGLKPTSVIPDDAFLIIEAERAVPAWNKLSSNIIWEQLKTNELLDSVSENIHKVDSIFKENKNLFKIFNSTSLTVSFHPTKANDFDFLIVVDLKKASGLKVLKDFLPSFAGDTYAIGKRTYNQQEIIELHSMEDSDIIYLSFINNLILVSFHFAVLESAIDKMNEDVIGNNLDFHIIKKFNKEDGLFKLYINHESLNKFINISSDKTDFTSSLLNSLNYSGFSLDISDRLLKFNGNSNINNRMDSYLRILQQSGNGEITVQEILPKNVCYMIDITCESFPDFYTETINSLKNSPEDYKEYNDNISKTEKLLDIDLKKNFIDWIGGEIAITQIEPESNKGELQLAIILKADNIRSAKKNLSFITEQIKKKTPVKFKEIDYHGYSISYLSVKGFFRPILGKMLSKFEKPYFTYIEDFVVFSNKPQTLKNIIDDFRTDETLEKSPEFYNFMKNFSYSSNIFIYATPPSLLRSIKPLMNKSQQELINKNINIINSFPRLGMQLSNKKNLFNSNIVAEFIPGANEIIPSTEDYYSESVIEEPAFEADFFEDTTENDIIEENDSLAIFKITRIIIDDLDSKIQEIHWDNKKLRASVELEDGIMHGEYREYYEHGEQKLRGQFNRGIKTGAWKAFDENGKLIEKRKFEE